MKRGTSERVRLKLEESSTQQARIDKYNEKVAEYKEGIVNASQRGVRYIAFLFSVFDRARCCTSAVFLAVLTSAVFNAVCNAVDMTVIDCVI